MADSSEIDAALVAKLLADAQLMAIVDGIYFDVAAKGKTRFVIVSLLASEDTQRHQARAFETAVYLVKAVAKSTTGADVKTAAARIDAVLDGGTLAPTGFNFMNIERIERVRYTEVDPDNEDERWQHRGGQYEVHVSAS